jgi:transcriptional regulator GlxA family with amidase domain
MKLMNRSPVGLCALVNRLLSDFFTAANGERRHGALVRMKPGAPGRDPYQPVEQRAFRMRRVAGDKNDAKTAILSRSRISEVGIVLYSGAQMSAVLGLTDLFTVANRLSVERAGADARELRISHWQAENETDRFVRILDSHRDSHPDTHQQQERTLDCLILPPTLDVDPQEKQSFSNFAKWVKAQHAIGTLICSVCGGAFWLATIGLLDGRSATTHWSYAELLATRFPDICVDKDKLIIDHGDVMTAGGVMAWIDLGLKLIDRFIGPTIMLETARFFLVDPAGREQRFYASFSPPMNHGDVPVLQVQLWLQSGKAESATVSEMAQKARLGERTFLRRFLKATGLTPTGYVQHLRVGKARASLEFTSLTINEISWNVGYEDTSSFRKVFQRIMGLTPGDYRRRFGVSDKN